MSRDRLNYQSAFLCRIVSLWNTTSNVTQNNEDIQFNHQIQGPYQRQADEIASAKNQQSYCSRTQRHESGAYYMTM